MVAKGRRGRGGKEWEFGISRCKLLYIEWMNDELLLYNTGNYIQYPVRNRNGKEHKKVYKYIFNIYIVIYIYTYIYNYIYSHFAV